MTTPLSNFGSIDVLKRALDVVRGGQFTTPIIQPQPQQFQTPINPVTGGSFVNPGHSFGNLPVATQPVEQPNLPIGGVLRRFSPEDFTGQAGFPEKPTGLGGLRPLGGFVLGQDEPQDPGSVSLFHKFGNKGINTVVDLLASLQGGKPQIHKSVEERNKVEEEVVREQVEMFNSTRKLTPEVDNGMRSWIKDIKDTVSNPEDLVEFAETAKSEQLVKFIDKQYSGGFEQFLRDSIPR